MDNARASAGLCNSVPSIGNLFQFEAWKNKPRKISWARNYSARYWFYSALKKSELHPLG